MADVQKPEYPTGIACKACEWRGSAVRVSCPACGGTDMQEIQTAGSGTIVDFVPVLYPPANLKDLGKYISVLVRFDEGFQMFGIMQEEADRLHIGAPIAVSSFDPFTRKLFLRLT